MRLAELFRAQTNEALDKAFATTLQYTKNEIVSCMNTISKNGDCTFTMFIHDAYPKVVNQTYYLPKGVSFEDVKKMFLNENEPGGDEGFKYTIHDKWHMSISW